MIVVCTNCKAKFRVADEKIGPRGAKVRCSRCQAVFAVHREVGTAEAAAPADPQAIENPFVSNPVRAPAPPPLPAPAAAAVPPAVPPPLPVPLSRAGELPSLAAPAGALGAPSGEPAPAQPPAGDPFAAPPSDPFSPSASSAAPDPFMSSALEPRPPDPFASSGPEARPPDPFTSSAPEARSPDPFTSSAPEPRPPDPFASSAPDGRPPDPFAAFARSAPPPPDPFAPPPAVAAPQDPLALVSASGSSLPLTDLSDLLGSAAAAAPAPATAQREPDDGGLALEERLTPPPMRVGGAGAARPFDELDGIPPLADPFTGQGGPALQTARSEGEPLPGAEALALGDEPAPAPLAAAAPAPPPAAPSAEAAQAGEPAAGAVPEWSAPLGDRVRGPGRHTSRFRSIAVNAVALAALLVIALAILVVWRTEGPIEARSLRPAAILTVLRTGRSAGPFATVDLRSGEYEREGAPPVLFVRGKVVSRAATPVGPIKVSVEIVRDGSVIARGETLAGGVPTPEELWRAKDAAALAEVARSVSSRAARKVKPGDQVPFLVPIGERPADLEGASLRVDVRPEAASRP